MSSSARAASPVSQGTFLVLVSALIAAPVLGFHDGGVANCKGCHTMHISSDGRPLYHWNPNGNPYLLMYGNATDTCLMCHSFNGAFDYGEGYGPGGDFSWVTKTFSWASHGGTTESSTGDSHGHNVVSGVFHIDPDGVHGTAPGGEFPAMHLGCTSCHDPHGNVNFRLLYDSRVGPLVDGTRFDFTADAPEAAGNSYQTSAGTAGAETDLSHTVYKNGMSDWCANCHPGMHSGRTTNFIHPTAEPLDTLADVYNGYGGTGDPFSGDVSTSYMALVPFEAVAIDLGLVDPANHTQGPGVADQVMCLTCHRAHASPFRDAGRWDFGATFLNRDSHPQITDTGATAQDVANRYYGYTFADDQRSLCNKCHLKDFGDAAP